MRHTHQLVLRGIAACFNSPGKFFVSRPGWISVGQYEGMIIELFPQFPDMPPRSYTILQYLTNRVLSILVRARLVCFILFFICYLPIT